MTRRPAGPVFLALVALWLLLAALPASSAGEALRVTATGVGALLGADQARARDEALRDAYRMAAEAAGVHVCSESETRDLQLFYDRVTTRSSGYVRSLRVLSEGPRGDLYRCEVEAWVVPGGPIQEDPQALATLIDMIGNPTVLVLVEDQVSGRREPQGRAFAVLQERLVQVRYHVVDPQQIARLQEKELVDKAAAGDAAAGRILARRFGADVLITGWVQATPNAEVPSSQGSLFSARSRNNLRAVVADTGQVLFSDAGTGKGLRLSFEDACLEALEDSTARAAQQLAWKLPLAYDARSGGARSLQIQLLGCSYEQRGRFLEVLQQMRSVSGVFPREYRGGVALIDFRSGLTSEDIIARLQAAGLRFQVEAVTANRLELRVP